MQKTSSVVFTLLALFGFSVTKAQTYFTKTEVGLSLGCSQYFGDLNDSYGFKTISGAYGIYARRHINPYISVKLVANYTHVSYDDKFNSDLYSKQRNLNFQSNIFEVAFQSEFNFFSFITGDKEHRITPYLTGGIGGFYYNPYTVFKGQEYDLRPLGTEGQNVGYKSRKYTNFAPCFPLGVGVKFWLKGGVNMTIEVADRLTLTDYMDDVSTTYVGANKFLVTTNSPGYALQDRSVELNSTNPLGRKDKQRGNTASSDQYMMAMVTMSWHFKTYKCPTDMAWLIKTY